jgi:hypothetical protein
VSLERVLGFCGLGSFNEHVGATGWSPRAQGKQAYKATLLHHYLWIYLLQQPPGNKNVPYHPAALQASAHWAGLKPTLT